MKDIVIVIYGGTHDIQLLFMM